MFEAFRFLARRAVLAVADAIVTAPVLRWTWSGLAEDSFSPGLAEFRPSDREAVHDMMAGRYLLASKLVETGGGSPFGVDEDNPDWQASLHAFSWLRHFRDVRDPGSRGLARTLVLDWIGNEGAYDKASWTLPLTAQRVMNWLRHLDILLEGANPEQARAIQRSLGAQIQSLRQRRRFARDPVDRLLTATALVAAEIGSEEPDGDLDERLLQLNDCLSRQIDGDGMHLSRNPATQLNLLIELSSLRLSLASNKSEMALEFAAQVERMHEALEALTLGSGEPAYFNGCGHVPHDTLIAVQSNAARRRRRSGAIGGYGILRDGEATVIADGGLVPPIAFAGAAHDSALAFEFSHGTELIIGSCGPAPANLAQSRDLFRQSIAHTGLAIDDEGAARLAERGPFRGRLLPRHPAQPVEIRTADHSMILRSAGWAQRHGVEIERHITLLSAGTTLVGQDRLKAFGATAPNGTVALRFHLAPGVTIRRDGEGVVRLAVPDGSVWSFLWEGASLFEDDSVRQSAIFGFQRTRQLVLETDAVARREIAWIFTREGG